MGSRNKNLPGRPYEWKTFREVNEISEHIAKGMLSLNLVPPQHLEGKDWQFLGIFSKNRIEWGLTNMACLRSKVSIVPFFDSLGVDTLDFVINQC